MKRGCILGAGGHGRVVAEHWRAQHPDAEFVFLDDDERLHSTNLSGIPVVGPLSALKSLPQPATEAVVGLGDNRLRQALAERFHVARWGRVVHPSATVMETAHVGNGTVILAAAVINSAAIIGEHVLINTGAIVEHDAVLEDFCSLAPGVSTGGRVQIGRGSFISSGVTLAPRVRIGEGTVVGAGAVVVADLPSHVLAYGVPARVIRPIDASFDWRRLL